MLYEFELGYNAANTTRNIYWAKGEGTVDHSTVTRWLKKCCLGYKNFDNQARADRLKSMDSKSMLIAIETNLASSTLNVSGELGISQFSMVHHLHDLSKSI